MQICLNYCLCAPHGYTRSRYEFLFAIAVVSNPLIGTVKLLVPIYYQDQRHEVILRENCSRRRFLKVVEKSIPELPEGILILQRYEKCEKRESTNKRLELTCGSELLLLGNYNNCSVFFQK